MATRENKKGSKSTGLAIVLCGVAVLLLASWLFAFGGAQSISPIEVTQIISPSIPSTPVNETYRFITYRNAKWGFSLQHPVGFVVEEPELDFPEFRAYASVAGNLPELIEVLVDNSTTASAAFQDSLATSSEAGETTSRTFTSASGETVRLIKTTSALPPAPDVSSDVANVFQAFFDCKDVDENAYTALVLVSIPKSLEMDLPVAEYVVNSFKC